jgi:hypothetical protein
VDAAILAQIGIRAEILFVHIVDWIRRPARSAKPLAEDLGCSPDLAVVD